MRNSLVLTPAPNGGGVSVELGNPGGSHGMVLSLAQVLTLEAWIATWRETGNAKRLSIPQMFRLPAADRP